VYNGPMTKTAKIIAAVAALTLIAASLAAALIITKSNSSSLPALDSSHPCYGFTHHNVDDWMATSDPEAAESDDINRCLDWRATASYAELDAQYKVWEPDVYADAHPAAAPALAPKAAVPTTTAAPAIVDNGNHVSDTFVATADTGKYCYGSGCSDTPPPADFSTDES
jgi:hypothetical protein